MDLLIVRHAIAYERDAKRWPDDAERPLTPEGMKLARKAAAGLKRITDNPETVWTSPFVRARQTAKILEHYAGWPKATEASELAQDVDPQKVVALLRRHRGKLVAVVGHEPGLSELISLCVTGERDGLDLALKKPGVACLSFKGAPTAASATLSWFVPPRILRALE
jgi:phosphohistidine phosphatase